MRIATTKANRIYWHKRLEGFDETLAMTFDEKLTRRYGLRIGGGRTRIRTRVFGLEGQSDIQLHYTSLSQGQGLHLKKVQQESVAQRGLAHLWQRLGLRTVVRFHS